jgi:hypothetical protein
MQDRVEEVLFWRKPTWTYAYMLAWGFICMSLSRLVGFRRWLTRVAFNPRLLLLLPSITLLLVILYNHERNKPLPSLIGVVAPAPAAGTVRVAPGSSQEGGSAFTASQVEREGGGAVPVVPPKEAESGVDYYLNVQAIQNLMGIV